MTQAQTRTPQQYKTIEVEFGEGASAIEQTVLEGSGKIFQICKIINQQLSSTLLNGRLKVAGANVPGHHKVIFELIEGQGYPSCEAEDTANRIHGYVEMVMQTGSPITVTLTARGLPDVSYEAKAHVPPTDSSPEAQPEPQQDAQ